MFTFYILSFVLDLVPSVRTRRHVPQGEKGNVHSEETETVPAVVAYDQQLADEAADPHYYRGQQV